jgi:hypothetical protein
MKVDGMQQVTIGQINTSLGSADGLMENDDE